MDIDKLRRLDLSAVASRLDLHPFDLIRLLVSADALPADLMFEAEDVTRISRLAGLESWLTEDLVADEDPQRALLRSFAAQMLSRGIVGERRARLDNPLRGLNPEQKGGLLNMIQALVQQGILGIERDAQGTYISIVEGQEYRVADIAEGGASL